MGTQGAPAAPQSQLWGCRSQRTYWHQRFLQDTWLSRVLVMGCPVPWHPLSATAQAMSASMPASPRAGPAVTHHGDKPSMSHRPTSPAWGGTSHQTCP